MRVLGQIPHPQIAITVFHMNEKYVIKLEAGQMEQVFKLPQSEAGGVEDIGKLLDTEFMQKALERFNDMFLSFKEARERKGIL